MIQSLKLHLNQNNDGTAGLIASVQSGKFSGTGEAWFNLSTLNDFANQIPIFMENRKESPVIEGGNLDGNGQIKDLLLSFRLYAFSDYRFGLHIQLADYPYTDCRKEEISRVEVELKPNKFELMEFSQQMVKLVNSEIKEAVLECR